MSEMYHFVHSFSENNKNQIHKYKLNYVERNSNIFIKK